MSGPTAACIVAALVLVSLAGTYWLIHRGARAEQHTGPDTLRLLQDLDAHLDEYVCEDPHLWEVFGRGGNWDIQEGLDRLRQAIRDEQNKGDHTP